MAIKVSVIIISGDNFVYRNHCIKSIKNQQNVTTELLVIEDESCQAVLDRASGEYIIFISENETMDQDCLQIAVDYAEKTGMEIVLMADKKFDKETGQISESRVLKACIERKLFKKEFLCRHFKKIISDNMAYGRYLGLSTLAGTDHIGTMPVCRLYTHGNAKLSGEEILQNYKLLYKEFIARGAWNKNKQKYTNWLFEDIAMWLDASRCLNSEMDILEEIASQLLSKVDIYDSDNDYYMSELSKNGVRWINGISEGKCFTARHCIDYEKIPIRLIKEKNLPDSPFISVIMPVYNTEKYVAEALDSLENQTFADYEIICIDDGSTDQSMDILLQYANRNPSISIYQQGNCGQSVARNRALKYARGQYVYFMDSDDTLQPLALEMLSRRCLKDDLDVLYFDGGIITELPPDDANRKQYESYYRRNGNYGQEVYEGIQLMTEMFNNKEYRVSPCLQLIRKEHLLNHKIYFHQGIIHEDNIFNFMCMVQAKRVAYYGVELFNRRVRNDSVMTKKSTFENVYGYLNCYIDMLHWLQTGNLAEQYYPTVYALLDSLLRSAGYQYRIMNPDERAVIYFLKPYERVLCQKLILQQE